VATPLTDNLDGSYDIVYRLPSSASNPTIGLTILGDTVTTTSLDSLGSGFHHWALSLHGGAAIPNGTLANAFKTSISVAADVEYRFSKLISVEAYAGHDRFRSKSGGGDAYLTHVSGMGKFTWDMGAIRPFVHAGVGVYGANGGGAHFGWNVGGGVQAWLNSRFALETSYNFRNVVLSGGDLRYSTVQGGIRVGF
jgi:opacity protein-like surface antigen